jgi:hypothetical protein
VIVVFYEAYVTVAIHTTVPNASVMVYEIFNSNSQILRVTLYVVIILVSDLSLVDLPLDSLCNSVLTKSLIGVSYLVCLES